MTTPALPAYIEGSKIGGAALDFAWESGQDEFGHGFTSDGSRSPMVRKLEPISVRGILGLLAASSEWLTYRLAGPYDPLLADLVAAFWVGTVDPRLVDLSTLPYDAPGGVPGVGKANPATGPIREYARTVRLCYELALEFDSALHSYAETALRLVDHVMPNAAYRTWRRACYPHLTALTSSHGMREVTVMINERMSANATPYESTVIEQILADGDLDDLWGPALPRDAYDPKATPTPPTSTDLLAAFTRRTRSTTNPFLYPPSWQW